MSARVGFVGLGRMGWPMSRNLAQAGFDMTVRDVDVARQQQFAAEFGGTAADTPAAFAGVEAVVTMLPTSREVREVWLDWGLADAVSPGTVALDMSSSDPLDTKELGSKLAERGIPVVDAPVSGGVMKAEPGTLAIMIGGDDEAAVERVQPLLDALGERFFRTGPLGSGHAMKALNNIVAAAGFTAASEALLVGSRFGLDPRVMVDVMNASTGQNFSTLLSLPQHVLPRTFTSRFPLPLMTKDVAIAADLAEQIDVESPVLQLLKQVWAEALESEGPGVDHAVAFKFFEKRAGVELPLRPLPES